MPARTGNTTYVPGRGSVPTRRKGRRKPPKVSVPYAPTRKGKEAEEEARGHIQVPYAPTPTGKAAEKSARRARAVQTTQARRRSRARKAKRIEKQAFRTLRSGPPAPDVAVQETKQGVKPPESKKWRRAFPVAAKKADENFIKHVASKEGVTPDPLAEFVISTAATAGLGAAAKGVGTVAKSALASRAGSEIGSLGTTAAEKAVETGAKAARSVKGGVKARAGAKAKRIKSTPERIRTAPARAKKAASTKAGRRAATKGAARKARRHPVRTGYGAAAVSPVPLPGELDKRARAFAKGTAAATLNHPGKVLETTGHGVLGFLTAPLALGGAAVESVKEGSPKPLGKEAKALGEGTAKMVENLASGDPKRIERTTLQETGLVPFIPVPHVVRRLKGTKAYEEARGSVRGKVEGKRAKTREKRIEAEKQAAESGEFISKRAAKKVRQPIADTQRPGENYVLRKTGKLIEKQRSRHRVAREVTRIEEEGQLAGKRESEAVAKPLRKSPGTNQREQNDGEALRIFVNHGLPEDKATATAYIEMLHENWPKIEHGDTPPGVHLDRHSTKYIIDHPEIFEGKRGKQFFESVREFNRQSQAVGTSKRNQYLAQVNNVINPIRRREGKEPILTPEQRVTPEALNILPKRDKPWSRSEAFSYAKELRQIKGPDRAKALKQAQALTNSKRTGALDGLMRPPEHGGPEHGVSTTQADSWTPEMERDFVNEAKAEHPRLNLRDPAAYVADVVPSGLKGDDKAPNFAAELPVRKVWPSQGKASQSGNALSDFESTVYHSIEAPRAREAAVRGLNRVFDYASRKVMGKRFLTRKEVEKAIATRQVPEGTIFVRPQALKSVLEGEHTLDSEGFRRMLEGEVEQSQKLASGELAGEIEAMKTAGVKGEKFAPMDGVAINELLGHMQGIGGVSVGMGHVSNFVTRSILNSPAFEASQFVQEGIPGAAALGRNVVNVPRAIANLRQVNKLDAESQAMIRSVVGSSVGVLGAPSLKALRSEGFMNPIRAAGRTPAWRHAWNIVNGNAIGRFDRARAGRFRETAALAKIQGDFKRAEKGFGLWRSAANNMFRHEQQAIKDMHGMNASERLAYIAEHPRLGDQLMQDMQKLMGNWNSFTVFEKHIAPFAIFYPFQRYSVLWMLYHFPMDHPVVATGLAMLGQVNAQELQSIAAKEGATPNVLDYTKPVFGDTVLPSGQRFFPGAAAVQQAALEKKPAQAISTLSPAISIPLEALNGKSAYTGAPLDENGWLYAIRQFANLSPFMRFMGVPDLGEGKSPGSEAFNAVDPLRQQRSLFDPAIGQTAEQFGKEKKLEKSFDEKYGEGHIPGPFDSQLVIDLLFGNNGKPKPEDLPKVLREIHRAERASKYVKRAEAPFLPPSKSFSSTQKKLLQAVEDAWQTGPNAEPEEENQFGIPSTSSSELRKQFGLPDTSASKLREQFGIK